MDYLGHYVTLVPSTETYADATARTTFANTKYSKEGIFFLEVNQATYTNETINMYIQSYDELTDDWYTIISFTQVTDASSAAVQEMKKIDYGLGNKISCKWAITGGDSTNKYTITVTGVLK